MSAAPVDDRQEKFSGTQDVREAHRFDAAKLEAYLAERIDGFRTPLEVRQFKGGQSNPTYQLVTPNRKYVLRRKPPGKLLPSAHAVDREYRIISALHPTGFPVAKPYLLCEDESVIGTMFYVMDCVDGRIYWGPMLPDQTPAQRTAIYDAMNETFARLHNMDCQKLGLQDFGKPGNYVGRQVARWTKQYKASETETISEMEKLIEWLPQHLPTDARDSIVHGDYRLDNMILHPTEPKVIAVLHHRRSDGRLHLSPDAMDDAGGNDDGRRNRKPARRRSGGARNSHDGEIHGSLLPPNQPRRRSQSRLLRGLQFLPACRDPSGHRGPCARRHGLERQRRTERRRRSPARRTRMAFRQTRGGGGLEFSI
jgi:aminoglycoside phosphotransferase (APT) family kinase protein